MLQLNLQDLTQAHIDAALPNIKKCTYSSPCIIGTLLSEEDRNKFDCLDDDGTTIMDERNPDVVNVTTLIEKGQVQFPDEGQCMAAINMQQAFDLGDRDHFLKIAGQWVAK